MNNDFYKPAFVGCYSGFDEAEAVIFGAPFDGTVSFRAGTRFGPSAIRAESIGLETYSPYIDEDLTDYKIHDAGDLILPFGSASQSLDIIQGCAKEIITAGKKPVMIGGEHLVSLPVIREMYNKYNNLRVIHFDAHTDLREYFFGQELSHANVLRKAWDFIGDGKIFQYGIRSGSREEFYWAEQGHTTLTKNNFDGLENAVNLIGNNPVYFTLDLDVLDPSIMSGTGTTEAGGVTYSELLHALKIIKKCNIVGFDIVELSPHYDASGVSTAVACKTLRETLLIMLSSKEKE